MRHYTILSALLLFTSGFSQDSDAWKSLCPANIDLTKPDILKIYTDPLTENYHCIKDWDPCDASWWSSHSNITSVDGPFRKSAFTFPALLSDEGNYWDRYCYMPTPTSESKLKPNWVVYDRNILPDDHGGLQKYPLLAKKVADAGNDDPGDRYFSLYNPSTGQLRSFLHIIGNETAGVPIKVIMTPTVQSSKIMKPQVDGNGYGFGNYDFNGTANGVTLAESPVLTPRDFYVLTATETPGRQQSFWFTTEALLSYDPSVSDFSWLDPDASLFQFSYRVFEETTSSLHLAGDAAPANGSQGATSFFKDNNWALGAFNKAVNWGSDFVSDKLHALTKASSATPTSGTIAESMCNVFEGSTEGVPSVCQNGAPRLKAYLDLANNFGLGSNASQIDLVSRLASFAGPIAIDGISGLILSNTVGTKITYPTYRINLNGTIVTPAKVNTYNIPISSRDEQLIPQYSRGSTGLKPTSDTRLGLFNLKVMPRLRVSIKPRYYRYKSGNGPLIEEEITNWMDCVDCWIMGDFYVSVDDPACDLIINPATQTKVVSSGIKVLPVIRKKAGAPWSSEGHDQLESIGNSQNRLWFTAKIGSATQVRIPGSASGSRYTTVRTWDRNYESYEYGLNLFVPFATPHFPNDGIREFGSEAFSVQRIYNTQTTIIPPEQWEEDQGRLLQTCSIDDQNNVTTNSTTQQFSYHMSVTTGDVKYAGTDATIKAIVQGCDGLAETFILDKPNFDDNEKGTIDEFVFPLIFSHGGIDSVRLVSDNANPYHGWFIDNLSLTEIDLETMRVLNGNNLSIPVKTWLNTTTPSWEYKNPSNCPVLLAKVSAEMTADYIVNVSTADVKNAGTSADIDLDICGILASNELPSCVNKSIKGGVKQNSVNSLTFSAPQFKSITSVTVTHQGNGDAWRPDDITVNVKPRSSTNADALYQFSFRQWVESGASVTRNFKNGMAYDFTVKTADVTSAGTNASIYAQLCNQGGSPCVSFKLDNETQNDNEKGSISVYKFYSTTVVDDPSSLTLFNDLANGHPGWRPYSVTVVATNLGIASATPVSKIFWFDQWLAKGEGRGDANTSEFSSAIPLSLDDYSNGGSVSISSGVKSSRTTETTKYDFVMETADVDGAGTDANVWARLTTCGGELLYFNLDDHKDNFVQNEINSFDFFRDASTTSDNRIKAMALMHDNAEDHAPWDLLQTTLHVSGLNNNTAANIDYKQSWNAWIGKGEANNTTYSIPGSSKIFYGLEKSLSTCPVLTRKITGLARTSAQFVQGEGIEVNGDNLGGQSNQWTATLNGITIAVNSVSAGRIRLEIPQGQAIGTQSLTLSNASSALSWSTSVQVLAPTPTVTAISHVSRIVGEYFELLGQQFGMNENAIVVKIGSVVAPVVRLLDGRVSMIVPQMAAGTYNVTLSVHGQVAPQTFPLTIQAVIPSITGVQPSTVAPGATLGILGRNFGTDVSGIKVKLGNIVLTPSVVSENRISVVIPETTASGIYTVTLTRAGVSATGSALVEVLRMPTFLNFDDPTQQWTSDETTLQRDGTLTSRGSGASLQINGSGYRVIRSPRFNTTDLGQFSDTIAFDLYIPKGVSNPSWLGEAAFFVDDPAAGLNNAWQSNVQLTGLSVGAWHTIRIPLSAAVVDAMAGDYPNMQFSIVVNAAAATGTYHLDECRFVGTNLQYRTVEHQIGSRNLNVIVPDKLGFEASDPWVVPQNVPSSYVADPREQGLTALKIGANGFMHLESPALGAYELKTATSVLNVDVYVPDPQPNAWWIGNVAVTVDCPADGIYNQYLGQKDLTHLFRKEYNGIQFDIPTQMLMRLQQSAGGCKFGVDLNVTNGPAPFLLDKMGFVHTAGEVIEPSSSSSDVSSSSSSTASGSGVGTGSSFICTGMCAVATASDIANQTLTLGTTGEAWSVLTKLPAGWQGSEMAGRTVEVNGIAVTFGGQLPSAAKDGKWYFRFSAGAHSWASWSWWS